MRRTRKQSIKLLIGTGLLLGLGSAAQASFVSDLLTSGVQNDFEDQSREAFIDANQDGLFGVGDIYTGFLKMDDKTAPDGVDLENHVYAIFSQEVVNIPAAGIAELGPVTSDPNLTLASLGVPGAGPQDTIALFSSEVTPTGFSVDLITASPGEQTGNGTVTLADYFALILNEGTLELLAGIYDTPTCTGGTADCFQGTGVFASNLANELLLTLASSTTAANFIAGVETSLDPTGFTILDVTQAGIFSPPFVPITISELSISNGAARGSLGVVNAAEWINASELTTSPQCTVQATGANVPCGLVNDADFAIFPESIPEPATIALLGGGLLGLGAVRRRRRRHLSSADQGTVK